MSFNQIKVRDDGPLLCTGQVEVYDADGNLLQSGENLVLCRCGASQTKPFCDGSHRDSGFANVATLQNVDSQDLEDPQPLRIEVRNNAMLIARGPMEILRADGSLAARRNKAALCRCGQSDNKPMCDGSHRDCGFQG